MNLSDHRPIWAAFKVTVKEFDGEGRKKAKAALLDRWVDEQERLLVAALRFYLGQEVL